MPEDFEKLWNRVDALSTAVNRHEVVMSEHTVLIGGMSRDLSQLTQTAASREQVDSASENLSLKLQNVTDKLEPIQKALYWAVALICGSVVVALLALVLQK